MRERLAQLPGGHELLELATRHEGLYLVGGAVRDLLLGLEPRELDIAVEGDLEAVLAKISDVKRHARFATATGTLGGVTIDFARTRRERYSRPGALPDVEPASIDEDLGRRDFTVNAIALALPATRLVAPQGAREDLERRVLRVFHERSFADDPTRVMRLARYAERLGLEVEPQTAVLCANADLSTVSQTRVGAELRLVLSEPDPPAVLARLQDQLPLLVDSALCERVLSLLPEDSDRAMALLASVTFSNADEGWLGDLGLRAAELAIVRAAKGVTQLAERVGAAELPSQLEGVLRGKPVEVAALAGALGPAEAVSTWLRTLRHVTLAIGGGDLLAAGIPAGAQIRRRLEAALARRLDGDIAPGREAELAAALEAEA